MKITNDFTNRSWGRGDLVVNTSDSGTRGRGFEPHSGRRVVSLSKTPLKVTSDHIFNWTLSIERFR